MLSREMGAAGQAGNYRFAVQALATSVQDGDRSSGFRANPSLGHIPSKYYGCGPGLGETSGVVKTHRVLLCVPGRRGCADLSLLSCA